LEKDNFVKPEKTETDSNESNDIIKINENIELKFKKCLIDELVFLRFYVKIFVLYFIIINVKKIKNLLYVLR